MNRAATKLDVVRNPGIECNLRCALEGLSGPDQFWTAMLAGWVRRGYCAPFP